jgi:hypothetical protein
MVTLLAWLATFERPLIKARTEDGRKRAKERGVHFGRSPKLTSVTTTPLRWPSGDGHLAVQLFRDRDGGLGHHADFAGAMLIKIKAWTAKRRHQKGSAGRSAWNADHSISAKSSV